MYLTLENVPLTPFVISKKVKNKMRSNLDFYCRVYDCMIRFMNADWGNLDLYYCRLNFDTLKKGLKSELLGIYDIDPTIWIVMKRGHKISKVIFPDEYK